MYLRDIERAKARLQVGDMVKVHESRICGTEGVKMVTEKCPVIGKSTHTFQVRRLSGMTDSFMYKELLLTEPSDRMVRFCG